MPTAVYDASLLTYRKQAKALYAFQAAVSTQINAGNYVVGRPQYVLEGGDKFAVQKQGGCICTDDAAGNPINRATTGPCSCGR